MKTTKSIQIQTGAYDLYGKLIPVYVTILNSEVADLTKLGMTRSEAIEFLIQ